MSFPSLRKRTPFEPVIQADLSAAHGNVGLQSAPNPPTVNTQSGALSRIFGGLFGVRPNPAANLSAEVITPGKKALYHYHEGDLFTPGAENYVFDYPFEFPLQTIWGNAFLRVANTFDPLQPPQVPSVPMLFTNGIGGLIAGQIATQPLESDGQ